MSLWFNPLPAKIEAVIVTLRHRAAIGVENGKQIPLTPGMTVAAEVRTGAAQEMHR